MKQLFFDLETTGICYWKHGIHQISGEIVIDGETRECFDYKVRPNPRAQIEEEALRVGGVTREQILAYPPMEEVYRSFIDLLGKYVDRYDKRDKFFLVGYNNASFDNPFLKAFFVQNGDQYFYSWFWINSIDVMVLASQRLILRRPEMKDFRLETVAREMGIKLDPALLHDASYDIRLTRMLYDKLTNHS